MDSRTRHFTLVVTTITLAMVQPLVAHSEGTTRLADGRELGWAEFGDPDGDAVFWFHGTPGGRSQLPADAGTLAVERGLRIITVERPGTGHSSQHQYRQIVDFVADFRQVVVEREVDEFAVVGLSGGGPYLLAVAHEMHTQMVTGVVLGGIGPSRGSDAIVSHLMLLIPAASVLERVRGPLGDGLGALVRCAAPLANPAVDLFFNIIPGDREHMGQRPLDRRQFTADLVSAAKRSGMRAPIDDLILFGRHWGFELSNIKVPLTFYGGSSDIIVPAFHAERQSKRVRNSRLRTHDGRGHFAGYTEPHDVLDDIRAHWPLDR